MTDIELPEPPRCHDCKARLPLITYGRVVICHMCASRRKAAAANTEPIALRRNGVLEKPVRNRRCTDCQAREPDGRHWGDAYLCLSCENDMLERIDHPPYTVEHDRISA